jgi:predicted flavoprotein YhiN
VEKNPKLKVAILERGADVLQKVRISGGGRCNVTHACFEPNELVKISSWREKLRDLSINFLLVTP